MMHARVVLFVMSMTAEAFSVQRIVPYLAASVAALFTCASMVYSPDANGRANAPAPSRAWQRATGR